MADNTSTPATKSVFHSQPIAVPDPVSTFMPHLQRAHYSYFWGALLAGFGALVALTYETVQVHSQGLEIVFIVGSSFLVPSLYVYYLDLRNRFVDPRWRTIVWTFVLGAILAAPLAGVLEVLLGTGTGAPLPAFGTGLIEEFCKVLAVLWLLRKKHRDLSFEMDGIIIGAAAGMGFAVLEDILYGAGAFHQGLSVVIAQAWVRQILGPFGHGTWTAIVVGTIWREKGSGPVRITRNVIGAYLLAAGLHGVWDWAPLGIWTYLVVGVIGLYILRRMIRHALNQEQAYIDRYMALGAPQTALPAGDATAGQITRPASADVPPSGEQSALASPGAAPAATVTCPTCGATMPANAHFCGRCGNPLTVPAVQGDADDRGHLPPSS